MKEFTIEEKAKRYDEAIERARNLYNSEETSAEVMIACENIFPELEESEDERIRKAIIEMIHDTPSIECEENYNVSKEDTLAWLEKQGETFTKKDVDDAYLKGIRDANARI